MIILFIDEVVVQLGLELTTLGCLLTRKILKHLIVPDFMTKRQFTGTATVDLICGVIPPESFEILRIIIALKFQWLTVLLNLIDGLLLFERFLGPI